MRGLRHGREDRLALEKRDCASTVGTTQRGAVYLLESMLAVRADEYREQFVHEAYLL
jgi:hypothetical protein